MHSVFFRRVKQCETCMAGWQDGKLSEATRKWKLPSLVPPIGPPKMPSFALAICTALAHPFSEVATSRRLRQNPMTCSHLSRGLPDPSNLSSPHIPIPILDTHDLLGPIRWSPGESLKIPGGYSGWLRNPAPVSKSEVKHLKHWKQGGY